MLSGNGFHITSVHLSKEKPTRIGAVNGGVADRALLLSHLSLIVPARHLWRKLFANAGMTFKAKLSYLRPLQHLRVCRSMRSVTRGAALELKRAMLKDERSLLVGVALDTSRVGADCQLRLFLLESAVWIVAIAALHRAFEHLVMKWFAELRFRFVVARHAKLRLIRGKHPFSCLTGILRRGVTD